MNIGKLKKRLQVQRIASGQDSYGQEINEYATYATVWGLIEPLVGREVEYAKQISAETTHQVTIRYLDGMNTEHRIIYCERIFDIEAILNPNERNEYLIVMCKEVS